MLSRFVGSAGAPRDRVLDDPALVEDIRCIVRLRSDRELVIATELGGGIRVFQNRECLAQRARAQLSFHDVASSRVLEIDADELYIFDLQTLEMLPDAPGLNDALYLYGAMRGPHPARLDGPEVPVDGQLTVTRADLLAGLIAGHATAFCYAPDQPARSWSWHLRSVGQPSPKRSCSTRAVRCSSWAMRCSSFDIADTDPQLFPIHFQAVIGMNDGRGPSLTS